MRGRQVTPSRVELEGDGQIDEYLQQRSVLQRIARSLGSLGGDFRSEASKGALAAVLDGLARGEIALSIGGGPTRADHRLTNLNLAPYCNVDVVGTAYRLPFRSGSVAAVHCEAVLEHLEYPQDAVAEMHRVLAKGGMAYSCTPFLQAYHAYPDHFQNYTLAGHRRLFGRSGFTVLESGVSVGPSFAIVDLWSLYLRNFLPGRVLSRGLAVLTRALSLPFRALDRRLNTRESSHILASTTYVVAQKG